MAKLPALWQATDGSSTITQNSGTLLLENGADHLLLENGNRLALEATLDNPKIPAVWSSL